MDRGEVPGHVGEVEETWFPDAVQSHESVAAGCEDGTLKFSSKWRAKNATGFK